MSEPGRAETLERFARVARLPPIARVVQRGRDPETARYTIHLTDGREVRVGNVEVLFSRAKLSKVLAVTIQKALAPIKAGDWADMINILVEAAVEVEETPGETYEETVRNWTRHYIDMGATSDRNGAAAQGSPFHDDGHVHLTADGLARYIRREYSEQVKLHELRTALRDLGFERVTIHYVRGGKNTEKRSSTSYYQAPARILEDA